MSGKKSVDDQDTPKSPTGIDRISSAIAGPLKEVVASAMKDLMAAMPSAGQEVKDRLQEAMLLSIRDMSEYTPVVAIFGKTGVGKSSLLNAIFKDAKSLVSHVSAGTRAAERHSIKIGDRSIDIIDFPGIGEDTDRDKEYHDLYNKSIPDIDLVIWVIKVDDRAAKSDLDFWDQNIRNKSIMDRVTIVISQCEKANPMPDWHWRKDWGEEAGPGEEQRKTIDEKIRDVSDKFGISRDKIFTVSASEEYHIEDLSEHLIKTMPKEKRLGLAQNYRDYLSSSKTIWRWVVEGVQATLRSVAEKHGADIRDRLIDAALKALMGAVAAYFGFAAQL